MSLQLRVKLLDSGDGAVGKQGLLGVVKLLDDFGNRGGLVLILGLGDLDDGGFAAVLGGKGRGDEAVPGGSVAEEANAELLSNQLGFLSSSSITEEWEDPSHTMAVAQHLGALPFFKHPLTNPVKLPGGG